MSASTQPEVALRIVVVDPVPGVLLRVQSGKSELLRPTHETAAEVSFDLRLRVGPPRTGGKPNFLGAVAQGSPADRFIYVNAGRQAGQGGTVWDRRAKIPLGAITKAQLAAALKGRGAWLEVRIGGRARDGGPSCATVPPLAPGWQVRPPSGNSEMVLCQPGS